MCPTPALPSVSMTPKQKVVVIVDPYSSGRFLVQELASQQWPMVCIQSTQDLAEFWLTQHQPNDFIENIRHEKMDATLKLLAKYDIAAVLPGSEPGVLVAEDLQEALNLPCNGASTKDWRRNKYDMQERLREVDIRAVGQLYSNDVEEVLEWQQSWGKWPVIVKPSMSGGTDGVYWCHNQNDVREAFAAECGKLNCNGVVNEKLLIQEYLDGLEYIIDCVSFEGKHVLSGIWVYKKTKDPATKSITYEYAQLIESRGEIQDILVKYVFECLDALSFQYGPSHSEVIICSDGPCLVETGARLHGVKGPKMTEFATGLGTHELVIDVALHGGRLFKELYASDFRYVVKKWVFETMMQNRNKTGTLAAPLDVPQLTQLASFMDVLPAIKPGDELLITRDLATSPGIILQVHASLQQCLDDIAFLRQFEETDLFQVLPVSIDEVKSAATGLCGYSSGSSTSAATSSLPPSPAQSVPASPRVTDASSGARPIKEEIEPMFPAGHPLSRLVRPTFDTVQRTFAGLNVATIWNDSEHDDARGAVRPSYDSLYGPGSGDMMGCVASWLSTGPDASEAKNLVLFPSGMDQSLAPYMQSIGVLGDYEFVASEAALRAKVVSSGQRIYNIDAYDADFDDHVAVGAELSQWLNSKDDLVSITGFGPDEVVVDMYDITAAHFRAAARAGGRVYLKTCNTECAGLGVHIARTEPEFETTVASLRETQARYGLSRMLVVQPEIQGVNKSFQVLIDPANRERIQVVALSNQLVEDDGKTYKSSVNNPIEVASVEPVGAAILDMVDRVWAKHPEAFGFLMCDYFETKERPVLFDPGFRPTGNTATALAAFFMQKHTGSFHMTSLVSLPTGRPGFSWGNFAAEVGDLASIDGLRQHGRMVVPWGWNAIQGMGMVIIAARDADELDALRVELLDRFCGN